MFRFYFQTNGPMCGRISGSQWLDGLGQILRDSLTFSRNCLTFWKKLFKKKKFLPFLIWCEIYSGNNLKQLWVSEGELFEIIDISNKTCLPIFLFSICSWKFYPQRPSLPSVWTPRIQPERTPPEECSSCGDNEPQLPVSIPSSEAFRGHHEMLTACAC